jgi:hypothetical protein
MGLKKRRGWFLNFLEGSSDLSFKNKISCGKCKHKLLIMLVAQFSNTDRRYAVVLLICRPFQRLIELINPFEVRTASVVEITLLPAGAMQTCVGLVGTDKIKPCTNIISQLVFAFTVRNKLIQ